MQELHTTVLESSLSPTLPTPTTRDFKDGQAEHLRDGVVQTDTVARAVFNSGEVRLLKTPISNEGESGNTQTTAIKNGQLWLSNDVQDIALENGLRLEDRNINLGNYREISWGKFEPAIRRWEAVTRRAPSPTKPDGKDGAHRLSAEFTEWMMGLPAGWVTADDLGLKRNDQLKACGNGVVPQQAELALRMLLQGLQIEFGGGR
jgi:hypothetical protein